MEHKRTVFQNVDEERLKQLLLTTPETKKRSSAEQEDNAVQKGTRHTFSVAVTALSCSQVRSITN